jgi:putative hemin transport protein
MNTNTIASAPSLKEAWARLLGEQPKLRIRDAAHALGVSEAELLATGCGEHVTRLEGSMQEIFREIPMLGEVMALTRNDNAVHERKGVYRNLRIHDSTGLVLDEEIDLRIFFDHWCFAFAVEEPTRDGVRRSVQFFAQDGSALHKIYLQPEGSVEAFDALVARFRSSDTSGIVPVRPVEKQAAERPDEEIDFTGLYSQWRALEDTHDFFPLLKRFGVSRMQALRNAEETLATEVPADICGRMLEAASVRELPIMVFVGNRGIIQIHTGPVQRIVRVNQWLNVLDPRFNLHLREDAIASAWIVRKPTRDGVVTSIEIFDSNNDVIALFFGKRKPGIPESGEWRALVAELSCGAAPTGV